MEFQSPFCGSSIRMPSDDQFSGSRHPGRQNIKYSRYQSTRNQTGRGFLQKWPKHSDNLHRFSSTKNPSLTPFSGRRTACGSTQKGVARLEDEATTVGIPKGRRQIELKSRSNAGGRCKTLGHAPPPCRRPSKYIRDGSN